MYKYRIYKKSRNTWRDVLSDFLIMIVILFGLFARSIAQKLCILLSALFRRKSVEKSRYEQHHFTRVFDGKRF